MTDCPNDDIFNNGTSLQEVVVSAVVMEYAVVAQQVERILGKDEVVSSSLINSSILFIKENNWDIADAILT